MKYQQLISASLMLMGIATPITFLLGCWWEARRLKPERVVERRRREDRRAGPEERRTLDASGTWPAHAPYRRGFIARRRRLTPRRSTDKEPTND